MFIVSYITSGGAITRPPLCGPKFTRVVLKGGGRIRQGSYEVAHEGEAHRVVQNSGFTIKITILLCSRLTES